MGKYYWLLVTADEYELPLAVGETAQELANIVGVTKSAVENCVARSKSGRISKSKYVKVRKDEWESE